MAQSRGTDFDHFTYYAFMRDFFNQRFFYLSFPLPGDLGLDGSQQKNLKILIHALYSNPKVLYAPNNTGVTTIIKKVTKNRHSHATKMHII